MGGLLKAVGVSIAKAWPLSSSLSSQPKHILLVSYTVILM